MNELRGKTVRAVDVRKGVFSMKSESILILLY